MNLCHHEEDFGSKAEWHFFAIGHGNEQCDGLGGTIKIDARKASLNGAKISTAEELYTWAINWSGSRLLNEQ